jgi:hypothetical protein
MSQNEDPMGDEYWAQFEIDTRQVETGRNQRAAQYGGIDPITQGWPDSSPAVTVSDGRPPAPPIPGCETPS